MRSTAPALVLLAAGCAAATYGEPQRMPGATVYAQHCAGCHGQDGQPELPGAPDFTRGQSLLKSDAALLHAIRFGVGAMPGFDGVIDNRDLIDVVFYIRTLER